MKSVSSEFADCGWDYFKHSLRTFKRKVPWLPCEDVFELETGDDSKEMETLAATDAEDTSQAKDEDTLAAETPDDWDYVR